MATMAVAILCVFFGAWLARRGSRAKQAGVKDPVMDGIISTAQLTLQLSKQNMTLASKVLESCQNMTLVQGQATQMLLAKIEKLVTEDILDAKLHAMFGDDDDEDDLVDEDEPEAEENIEVKEKQQDDVDVTKLRAANLRMFRTIEDFRKMVETSDKLDPKLKAKFENHLKIG